jgi:hypothetical protein
VWGIRNRERLREPPRRRIRDNSRRLVGYDSSTPFHPHRLIALAPLSVLALVAPAHTAQLQSPAASIIERVVSRNDPPAVQYRALRRLEAQSDKLGGSAWIEAWTQVDPGLGFRYQIIGEGGSGFVRGKVLRPWLDNEQKMWADGDPERASLSYENYAFTDRGLTPDGLAWLDVKARRKDLLLVDGSIFVNPLDADLVRIQGRLSKTPSFWTRRVEVTRHSRRINSVRMPTAIESVAQVLIAGRSTFQMTYAYASVNSIYVGDPQPTVPGKAAAR